MANLQGELQVVGSENILTETTCATSAQNLQTQPDTQTTTPTGTLRLTLVPKKKKKKTLKWSEDTVDNENMGKKSSKKCCIFHARRQFGDWSDDSDSESIPAKCPLDESVAGL